MGTNKKSHSDEIRQTAVKMVVEDGQSTRSVGAQLNVHHTSVAAWVRKYRRGGLDLDINAPVVDKDAHIRRLERELAQTRMERDFLKKATSFVKQARKNGSR